MQARKLIDGASFGPDALKAIGQAFDEAWAEVAPHFPGDPLSLRRGPVSRSPTPSFHWPRIQAGMSKF